jgi:GTPase SAR1 family protein
MACHTFHAFRLTRSQAESLCEEKAVKKLTKEYIKSGGREAFAYVLEHLERLKDPSWVPTNDDILFARSRTTGFSTTSFKIGSRTWTVIDVGGQKVERKKWIHARGMEIDALIYFCPIGDFCVKADDDENKHKVQEALEVWDEVMNGEGLGGIPVILFFNKKDLLETRLKQNSVKNFIPGFEGANEYQPVIDFAKKKCASHEFSRW